MHDGHKYTALIHNPEQKYLNGPLCPSRYSRFVRGRGGVGSGWGASRGMLAAGRGRAQGRQAVSGRHHADHWDWADG